MFGRILDKSGKGLDQKNRFYRNMATMVRWHLWTQKADNSDYRNMMTLVAARVIG